MNRFTIAMAVLTSVLFAGALYQTCGPDPSGEELACEALKPQIAEFAALQEAKRAQVSGLFAARARPGARFGGIAIGERAGAAAIDAAQNITTPTAHDPYAIWISDTSGVVTRIEVQLGLYQAPACERDAQDPCACVFESDDRPLCDDVGQQLARAWGAPDEPGVWIEASSGRRATFRQCTLVFE